MSDPSTVAKSLRERLGSGGEDRLGRALSDLLENPLLHSAIGHAFDAREKASQAQEVALGALNIPSAADVERLTRRLRSVSNRLEGIEDGVDRLDRALSPGGLERSEIEQRLSAIETQLRTLTDRVGQALPMAAGGKPAPPAPGKAKAAGDTPVSGKAKTTAAKPKSSGRAKPAAR
jgi:hypothetical protein